MSTIDNDINACNAWLAKYYPHWLKIEQPILVNKAGILPLFKEENGSFSCMLMKPKARIKNHAAPGWQITKGTRMYWVDGEWHDLQIPYAPLRGAEFVEKIETLACTALRETIEEIGLKLENILTMYDFGIHGFTSEKTGVAKQKALFACVAHSREDFIPLDQCDPKTEARAWFPLSHLPNDVRADNLPLIQHIHQFMESML